MIKNVLEILLLLGGLFFFSVGTIGILRFPDVMTRIHSGAKCDTLGLALSLSALALHNGFNFVSVKLMLVIVFVWISNPTIAHLIAKAANKK